MKIRSPGIPQCPPCAASTRELGQHWDETPALLPACQAGALCPGNQRKQNCQVTQEGRDIAIHFQTNRINDCSADKSLSEVSSKGFCDTEADRCLAQVPPLPPAAPPSRGESILHSQQGSRTEQASVTLCQSNTELDGDKSILLYQSPVLASGSTLSGRHHVMKITAQTKGLPCPMYFLASSQKHEQFAAQQLTKSDVDLSVFIGSGGTSCPS